MQVQAELDELRGKVAELEARFEEVEEELSDAEDVRSEAEGWRTAATKERDEAAAALKKLKGSPYRTVAKASGRPLRWDYPDASVRPSSSSG